ncbi:MAG: GNAT family N-acetyltransferase [Tatlockia sp.]|nr:GNAT family N-acetyltransferase [Tatlockia sp.]
MSQENKAILSTFIEVFKSFQQNSFPTISLQNDPKANIQLTGLNELFFNTICIRKPIDQQKLISELKNLQRDLKITLTLWLTFETETPEIELLLKDNFETPGPFYGMFLELNEAKLSSIPINIEIETIKTPFQAQQFAKIYSEVFQLNIREECERWAIKQFEMDNADCVNFIARLDGQIAGISSLAIDRTFSAFKTGGFYNACVLPEFRKKGVGTAMACHRITIAKEIGLQNISIVLMSDAKARGYCEKLGFQNLSTLTPYFIK